MERSPERKTGAHIEHQPKQVKQNQSRLLGKQALKTAGVQKPIQQTQKTMGQTAVKQTQVKRSR